MLVSLTGSKFVSQHITKIIVLLDLKESVCVFGIDLLFPAYGNKLSGATPCPALMGKLCAFPVMISSYSRPLLCFEQQPQAFEFGFDQVVLASIIEIIQ